MSSRLVGSLDHCGGTLGCTGSDWRKVWVSYLSPAQQRPPSHTGCVTPPVPHHPNCVLALPVPVVV